MHFRSAGFCIDFSVVREVMVYVPHPRWAEAVLPLDSKVIIIYDVLDDYAEFPTETPRKIILKLWERELLRRANVVTTCSPWLHERLIKSGCGKKVILLPNAVWLGFFSRPIKGEGIPPDLHNIPRPRIMFVGNLTTWVDYRVIMRLAFEFPAAGMVLVGPQVPGCMPPELSGLPNCFLLGPRPIWQIPSYMKAADCLILPRTLKDYSIACDPLKMREYLASGLPVVASALPAMESFRDFALLADSEESFVSGVRKTLLEPSKDSPSGLKEQVKVAESWSWIERAKFLLETVRSEEGGCP